VAGTATRFDAATDRVSYVPGPGNPPDGPFTICLWVYLTVDAGVDTSLYRRYTSGGSSRGQIATNGDGVSLAWFPSGHDFTYALTVGAWSRIAVVVDGSGNITSYAGDPTGALTSAAGSAGTTTGANQVTLAAISVGNGGQPLNGRLARVRSWAAALTESALEDEFDSTTPVRTADLWADWPLATDLNDASGNARHLAAGGTAVTFSEDGPPAAAGADVAAVLAGGAAGVGVLAATRERPAVLTGAGGGVGAATAARETVAVLAGAAGGAGAVVAVREVGAALAGAGGGASAIAATREVSATAAGSGGGSGVLVASVESASVAAVLAGTGAGAGQMVATREVRATMTGAAGGVGALVVPAPDQPVVDSGGWGSLLAITRDQVPEPRYSGQYSGDPFERLEWQQRQEPVGHASWGPLPVEQPTACPNDGEPLHAGPRGLHCPFDGWTWP
jgi:hypothetical protein